MAAGAASQTATTQSLREQGLDGTPLNGTVVIDNHCHIGPAPHFYQTYNDAAGMVRTMDRVGMDQACIFSSMAILLDMREGNDISLDAARQFPDRLLAYGVPDPHEADLVRDELQRCLDAGAVGIKLHTGTANYPFDGPGYLPAFELADAHRLPLISHGVGTPDTLRRIARDYPGGHYIVAHAGGGSPSKSRDLVQVAAEEPNVYLDTAASVGYLGDFTEMVRITGAEKILYGSDMPWTCATYQLGRVLLSPITDAEKRRILGENLAELFKTKC